MDISFSRDAIDFREEVRAFLNEKLTPELRRVGRLKTSIYTDLGLTREWHRILYEKGWVAPGWPKEYGGCGWSPLQRFIYEGELRRADAPILTAMGIDMCGPVLIGHGTEEQKNFYLPRILSGEDFWCQGYSEPNSGSDLASVQMSAVDAGDHFVCNGQKIWTTLAQAANRIFCLVRSSKENIPQKGITFLLIDMQTPGVKVEPIHLMSGEHVLNAVFFTDVKVPKKNVVGKIGDGWTVAKYLLQFERGGMSYTPPIRVRHMHTLEIAKLEGMDGKKLIDNPDFMSKYANISVQIDALEMTEFRIMAAAEPGAQQNAPAAAGQPSLVKTRGTEISQEVSTLTMEAIAYYGMPFQPGAAIPPGDLRAPPVTSNEPFAGPEYTWPVTAKYLNDRAGSIFAGSNEVQRNIISKAVIGL